MAGRVLRSATAARAMGLVGERFIMRGAGAATQIHIMNTTNERWLNDLRDAVGGIQGALRVAHGELRDGNAATAQVFIREALAACATAAALLHQATVSRVAAAPQAMAPRSDHRTRRLDC